MSPLGEVPPWLSLRLSGSLNDLVSYPCCFLSTSYPRSHGIQYHLYADGHPALLSHYRSLSSHSISNCFSNIPAWMVHCLLKFNMAKIELLVSFNPNLPLPSLWPNLLTASLCTQAHSLHLCFLSFVPHIQSVVKFCHFLPYSISRIRQLLCYFGWILGPSFSNLSPHLIQFSSFLYLTNKKRLPHFCSARCFHHTISLSLFHCSHYVNPLFVFLHGFAPPYLPPPPFLNISARNLWSSSHTISYSKCFLFS